MEQLWLLRHATPLQNTSTTFLSLVLDKVQEGCVIAFMS